MKKIKTILILVLYHSVFKYFVRLAGVQRTFSLINKCLPLLKKFSSQKIAVIKRNINIVFEGKYNNEDLDHIVTKILTNNLKNHVAQLQINHLSRQDCISLATFHGVENLYEVLSSEKGAILTFHHSGSQDLALNCLGAFLDKQVHLYAYSEFAPLLPRCNSLFIRKHGNLHTRSFLIVNQRSVKQLMKSIMSKNIVAIAFDGIHTKKFIEAQFKGYTMKVSEGLFKLSTRMDTPILPFFSNFNEGIEVTAQTIGS
ncbi:hypothetical protein ACFL27_14705 [candidate division CSSED10-310 bacterium]|uniref:Lipid A biosynthesis lauroyl acyltransferase n=1 Tax=candidate division CSSED10-310 bacterium TaxID=2855610 RepID=A0ABV6YZF0_UNCC1